MEGSKQVTVGVEGQKSAYDQWYNSDYEQRSCAWLSDADPAMEYLRNRRLRIGLADARRLTGEDPRNWSALVICGGVGAEGSFLADAGLKSVTVCDISEAALGIAGRRDPRLFTTPGNGESLPFEDQSFDLVVVRDGLHHLPRPVLGLNEMLRVTRQAAIVCEPHTGLTARLLGTDWEQHGDSVNFVFRWNRELFNQCVMAQWLRGTHATSVRQIWDHGSVSTRLLKFTGRGGRGLAALRGFYGTLDTVAGPLGNNMVGTAVLRAVPAFAGQSLKGRITQHT